jgi:hypothetical protein
MARTPYGPFRSASPLFAHRGAAMLLLAMAGAHIAAADGAGPGAPHPVGPTPGVQGGGSGVEDGAAVSPSDGVVGAGPGAQSGADADVHGQGAADAASVPPDSADLSHRRAGAATEDGPPPRRPEQPFPATSSPALGDGSHPQLPWGFRDPRDSVYIVPPPSMGPGPSGTQATMRSPNQPTTGNRPPPPLNAQGVSVDGP